MFSPKESKSTHANKGPAATPVASKLRFDNQVSTYLVYSYPMCQQNQIDPSWS